MLNDNWNWAFVFEFGFYSPQITPSENKHTLVMDKIVLRSLTQGCQAWMRFCPSITSLSTFPFGLNVRTKSDKQDTRNLHRFTPNCCRVNGSSLRLLIFVPATEWKYETTNELLTKRILMFAKMDLKKIVIERDVDEKCLCTRTIFCSKGNLFHSCP